MNCRVCGDEVPDELVGAMGCGCRVCTMCIDNYVRRLIEINKYPARCLGCNQPMSETSIGVGIREVYLQSFAQFRKSQDPNLRPCRVPDCNGFYHINVDGCCDQDPGHKYCQSCGGGGCNYFRMTESRKRRLVPDPVTKKCPGCRHGVERTGGCDHMTCSRCRHEFCYICCESWDSSTPTSHVCRLK